MSTLNHQPAIRFALNGQTLTVTGRDALRPLSAFLREHRGLTGTKVVCAEGDCGACTVLLGQPPGTAHASPNQHFTYHAVDACILFTFQCHGTHIVTVEGLQPTNRPTHNNTPNLTVLQHALVQGHGSQCGFCTPGIVMALHALRESDAPALPSKECAPPQNCASCFSHDQLRHALSGNLCRCTGYQQIFDAVAALDPQTIATLANTYDESALLQTLQPDNPQDLTLSIAIPAHQHPSHTNAEQPTRNETPGFHRANATLHLPATLDAALQIKHDHPDALPVAGATDLGVQHNHGKPWPDHILAITALPELRACTETDDAFTLGGGANWDTVSKLLAPHFRGLIDILDRFGSPQIRQLGTLAGNIANGSPIADSLPFLMVMDAQIQVASHTRGPRRIPLTDFYTGYKQNTLAPDELITAIHLPKLNPDDLLHLEKTSKRRDMDISTFTAALRLTLSDKRNTIQHAAIALGGVGPTVARLPQTESQLIGQPFTLQTLQAAGQTARHEIKPLSDVRGSAQYRQQLAENIFQKAWHQWQNDATTSS